MVRNVRFDCQRLEVFGHAVEAVAVIDELVEELPEGRGYIRDQLRRAANSIALGRWRVRPGREGAVLPDGEAVGDRVRGPDPGVRAPRSGGGAAHRRGVGSVAARDLDVGDVGPEPGRTCSNRDRRPRRHVICSLLEARCLGSRTARGPPISGSCCRRAPASGCPRTTSPGSCWSWSASSTSRPSRRRSRARTRAVSARTTRG